LGPADSPHTHTRLHIKLAAVDVPSLHGFQRDWNHIEQQPGHMWEWMSEHLRDFHAVVVPTPLELGVTTNGNTCLYNPVFNEQTQKWSSSHTPPGQHPNPIGGGSVHQHQKPRIFAGPVETDESSRTIHFLLRGDGTIPQQDLAEVVIRANAAITTATLTAVPTTPTKFDAAWRAATANPGQERIIVPPPAKRCCNCRLSEPACTCVAEEAARNPLVLCVRCAPLVGHAAYPRILCGYAKKGVAGGCYAMHQAHAAAAARPNAWITACAPDCPTPGLCRTVPSPFVRVLAPHLVPLQPWRAPWTPSLGESVFSPN